MITVAQLKTLCEDIVTNDTGLDKGYLLVVDEKNAQNKMNDKLGIVLVAALPSGQSVGSLGSRRNQSAVIFFILEQGASPSGEDTDQIGKLQSHAIKLQGYLENRAEEGCDILHYLETGSILIDPVFNEFGGYNGWSISAVF